MNSNWLFASSIPEAAMNFSIWLKNHVSNILPTSSKMYKQRYKEESPLDFPGFLRNENLAHF